MKKSKVAKLTKFCVPCKYTTGKRKRKQAVAKVEGIYMCAEHAEYYAR